MSTDSMLPEKLEFRIDEGHPADRSVVLRYAPALLDGTIPRADVQACSRREGMSVVDLGEFRGVQLAVLDETTAMASGTYKSLAGCVSTALCRRRGIARAVFSSGANAGAALTLYGQSIGLESFFFCPAGNIGKLDGALFGRPTAHLVAVEGSDRRVKQAASLFAQRIGAPVIPALSWRMLSAANRGLFLAEQAIRNGRRVDWLVQAVCAGYGPLGTYSALGRLAESGSLDRKRVPRFLGVQQGGLCPIVQAWRQGQAQLPPMPDHWHEAPIESVLYNTHPDQTYPMIHRLLKTWGGDMIAVDQAHFAGLASEFVSRLGAAGMRLTRVTVDGRSKLLESAGVLAGAGAMLAITEGRISPGQTVLCALTGGGGPAPARPAMPDHRIDLTDPLESAISALAERHGPATEGAGRAN